MSDTGYASVILDVDSTLCGVEGIDWLAGLRGSALAIEVTSLTARAMAGEIALDAVYGERLSLVRPTRDEIASLAEAYAMAFAPEAERGVRDLLAAGRQVVLVSGGVREALLPVAARLGIPDRDVHAVSVQFDERGQYAGFDTSSPLSTAAGKCAVASTLALPSRVIAMGDGATDLAMRPAIDAFAAFTGFVRRDAVVDRADVVLESFAELVTLVLGASAW